MLPYCAVCLSMLPYLKRDNNENRHFCAPISPTNARLIRFFLGGDGGVGDGGGPLAAVSLRPAAPDLVAY